MATSVAAKRRILLFLLLNITIFSFYAQSAESFIQKLEWMQVQNSTGYIVEIKNIDTENIKSYETKELFIEVSLPAGQYEYRVKALDFLNRPSSSSAWRPFTILKAVAPEVVIPETIIEKSRREKTVQIPVELNNIEDDSAVVFINTDTNEEVPGTIIHEETEDGVKTTAIELPQARYGNWKIKITNPSGITTETDEISIQKPVTPALPVINLFASLGYAQTFYIYNGELDFVFHEMSSVIPTTGAGQVQVAFLPFNYMGFTMGGEFQISAFSLGQNNVFYDLDLYVHTYSFLFVAQKNIIGQWLNLNLKLGPSIYTIIEDLTYKLDDKTVDRETAGLGFNLGASVVWIPTKHFYAEAGLAYVHYFIKDYPTGFVQPYINGGVRF
ncbi:MAG: hypothetical protein MJ160_00105 [Treponema sp.]|nr:hypothetical protein [Treponema sp.]